MRILFLYITLLLSLSLTAQQQPVTISINAYSFNDLLSARSSRTNEQVYTYFNLLDWLASQQIKALDVTGYYFPTYPEVPSDEYLRRFKEKARSVGVSISGTGIRNNFASPDPKIRAEGVELAKKWLVAARKMGAPVLRVFSGEIPKGYENNWTEVAGWMIDCYKQLIPFAQKEGVRIGIQNHGDMLQTAEQCAYVLNAVQSEWVRLVLDIGSFRTEDPYQDIAAMIPYAVNWQIKASPFAGGIPETDMNRLFAIIQKGGYKGFLPIETLPAKGKSYDPFEEILRMKKKVEEGMRHFYSIRTR